MYCINYVITNNNLLHCEYYQLAVNRKHHCPIRND